MDFEILKEIGLSNREIAVYKSLLKLGNTTTGPLVKLSGVQNAKIYETLEKLINKGLTSYIVKGKIKYFQASNPNVLYEIIKEKEKKLKQTIEKLKTIQKVKDQENETKVYEGLNAIKSIFFELYEYIGKNSEYYVFPIGEQLNSKELILFWSQVLHKQRKMKIKIKSLPNKKWKKIFQEHYKKFPLIKIKYTNQFFPTGIFIFKNHILNIIWEDKPIAFLIKSKKNYEQWKLFFDEQWKNAKP